MAIEIVIYPLIAWCISIAMLVDQRVTQENANLLQMSKLEANLLQMSKLEDDDDDDDADGGGGGDDGSN